MCWSEALTVIFWLRYLSKVWVKSRLSELNLSKNETKKARIRDIYRFAAKERICPLKALRQKRTSVYMIEYLNACPRSKSFNMEESACLKCVSWSFYWRNSPRQPFLNSNWHFWQMTQMSDKSLLSKTDKTHIWTNSDNLRRLKPLVSIGKNKNLPITCEA